MITLSVNKTLIKELIMNTKETIIFGGSFNPPTKAHRIITAACRENNPEADIWLMPSGERYDKKPDIPVPHRLGMLRAMIDSIEDNDRIDICPLEITTPGINETRKTARRLAGMYPDRQFRYVFGADVYFTMPQWQGGEELRSTLPILLVSRIGSLAVQAAGNVELLPLNVPDISSTRVRANITENRPIDGLVCEGVQRYIRDHGLYAALATAG